MVLRGDFINLDWLDFEARMYDPTVASPVLSAAEAWYNPDPAEQFINPYLAMGNSPTVYVDPDGEFVIAAFFIGAAISGTLGYMNGRKAGLRGADLAFHTFFSATVGGTAGMVGAEVGSAVSSSLSVGGFSGGFLAGSAGGGAGGFVGGSLGAAVNNQSLGTNEYVIKAGLKGFAIGGFVGGIGGGLTQGISDMNKGYDFWDGSKVDQLLIQGGDLEIRANSYNSSSQASMNDEILKLRILDEYRVAEGDFGIQRITTKAGRGFGLSRSNSYVNLKDGTNVGGYVRRFSTGKSHLHVSPKYALADNVAFKAVAEHEVIHAYHHYPIPNYESVFSERVAYKYTFNTYMSAGQFDNAMKFYLIAKLQDYWGYYPSQYQVPSPFGW